MIRRDPYIPVHILSHVTDHRGGKGDRGGSRIMLPYAGFWIQAEHTVTMPGVQKEPKLTLAIGKHIERLRFCISGQIIILKDTLTGCFINALYLSGGMDHVQPVIYIPYATYTALCLIKRIETDFSLRWVISIKTIIVGRIIQSFITIRKNTGRKTFQP